MIILYFCMMVVEASGDEQKNTVGQSWVRQIREKIFGVKVKCGYLVMEKLPRLLSGERLFDSSEL